jgi:adenosine deaminase
MSNLFDFALPGGGPSISALPKVSLHDHLDGGLRPQTIIELAEEIGYALPSTDAEGLQAWWDEKSNSGNLVDYLSTFDITTAVMQKRDHVVRVARDFVNDLQKDGVIYGEIRWAPERHLEQGLTLDGVVEAVQEGIEAGIADAAASGHSMKIGQLITAMRMTGDGLDIAKLAVRHRDNGVVGFDIAGPELGFPPRNLKPAFDYLVDNFMPRTVHAGEADGIESIRGALIDGRAMRLGHGVRIAEDITQEGGDDESTFVVLGEIAQWVKDREIALELAPSSNLQTNAWGTDLIDHPFDLLYQLGFMVTVNTDNRLMSNTSITKELFLLAETFGYGLDDFEIFQLNAAASTFLSLDDREELSQRIITGFENL